MKIKNKILQAILEEKNDDFELIEDEIDGSVSAVSATAICKDKNTGKYFKFNYIMFSDYTVTNDEGVYYIGREEDAEVEEVERIVNIIEVKKNGVNISQKEEIQFKEIE